MRRFALIVVLFALPAVAQHGPQAVVVAPVEVRAAPLTQSLVATVEPVTRSTLAMEEPALVAERFFDEGQRVEKGALLARGKADLVQAQRDAAEAAHQSAIARLAEARATAENATKEVERVKRIYETNVGSVKELHDAMTAEQVAQATVQVRTAEIAEKKAEVARLDLLLTKTRMVSPIAGVISRRYIEVGEWLEQGAAVADIVQLDPLFVRVNVPEALVSRIKSGDQAEITFDALGGKTYTGKIEQIIPTADPSSRTFPVKILLSNSDMKIWPGFFGRAVVRGQSAGDSFLVPRDAIATAAGRQQVIAARGGKAVPVPVTLGPGAGEKVSVTGELTAQDVVVVRGNEMLRGGEDLIVQNAPGPTGNAPKNNAPTTNTVPAQ